MFTVRATDIYVNANNDVDFVMNKTIALMYGVILPPCTLPPFIYSNYLYFMKKQTADVAFKLLAPAT